MWDKSKYSLSNRILKGAINIDSQKGVPKSVIACIVTFALRHSFFNNRISKEVKMMAIARHFKAWISKYFSPIKGGEIYTHQNKAIRGYDPVAFFLAGRAVKGDKDIEITWQEATWHFSNNANKEAFEATPAKYAPKYGGYCAHGIANGYKAQTEISTWVIVDNKLYFSYSQKIRRKWDRNRIKEIKKADKRWEKLKSLRKIKYLLP